MLVVVVGASFSGAVRRRWSCGPAGCCCALAAPASPRSKDSVAAGAAAAPRTATASTATPAPCCNMPPGRILSSATSPAVLLLLLLLRASWSLQTGAPPRGSHLPLINQKMNQSSLPLPVWCLSSSPPATGCAFPAQSRNLSPCGRARAPSPSALLAGVAPRPPSLPRTHTLGAAPGR